MPKRVNKDLIVWGSFEAMHARFWGIERQKIRIDAKLQPITIKYTYPDMSCENVSLLPLKLDIRYMFRNMPFFVGKPFIEPTVRLYRVDGKYEYHLGIGLPDGFDTPIFQEYMYMVQAYLCRLNRMALKHRIYVMSGCPFSVPRNELYRVAWAVFGLTLDEVNAHVQHPSSGFTFSGSNPYFLQSLSVEGENALYREVLLCQPEEQDDSGSNDKPISMEALIEYARRVAEAKGVRIAVQVLCGDK